MYMYLWVISAGRRFPYPWPPHSSRPGFENPKISSLGKTIGSKVSIWGLRPVKPKHFGASPTKTEAFGGFAHFTGRSPPKLRFYWAKPPKASVLPGEARKRPNKKTLRYFAQGERGASHARAAPTSARGPLRLASRRARRWTSTHWRTSTRG